MRECVEARLAVVLVGRFRGCPGECQRVEHARWGTAGTDIEEILNCAVWVEERCTHSSIDFCPREPHALHVLDGCVTLGSESEGRWVVEVAALGCSTCAWCW